MPVRSLQPPDIESLVQAYPYKPFRNYRALSRRRQDAVMHAEIASTLDSGGAFAVVADEDRGAAAAVTKPLKWDSAFFDISMARMTHLLHGEETPASALAAVVDGVLDRSRRDGIQHLSVRVDAADTAAVQMLEEHGFRLTDALVTYIYDHRQGPPAPVKEMGMLRLFQPEDLDQVVEITRDAYRGFRGRYHLDPHLPRECSDRLYVEWARKACAGEWADVVLVAENGHGRIHGWASYRRLEPVSSISGVVICGGGLGACRRDTPGAYTGLIRAAIERIQADGAITECQTQLFNFPTIRVYDAAGTRFVRAEYTLHRWLEP